MNRTLSGTNNLGFEKWIDCKETKIPRNWGIFCCYINFVNAISKIKSLNLPLGKYIVVGGCVLEVLNIRPSQDIDIMVSQEIYNILKSKDWTEVVKPSGIKVLQKFEFEVGTNSWSYGIYTRTLDDLLKSCIYIQGVPFVNLDEIVLFKQQINREKDRRDIDLINKFKKENKLYSD